MVFGTAESDRSMSRSAIATNSRPGAPQRAAPGGIDRLVAIASDDLQRVNQLILSRTGSDVAMIPEVARHLISSGGKRLRPLLTIAAAQAAGYRGAHHVALAAAVEFMHTATLLHDDVVDESEMRRGRKTARMLWGNQASVLVGDFLLGQAFKMMVDTGSMECLAILSHAATVIAEGEVLQLQAAKSLETGEDRYMAVIRAKTAALFAAACEVGPALVGRSGEERAALASYGMNLGIAFQLVDDALDYAGDEASLGKRVGDDFREGKITLPVILAHRAGDGDEKAFWRRTIEAGDIRDGDLSRAIGLLGRHRALEETMARARARGDLARANLAVLPPSPARDAIDDVVDFAIGRAH
jgi:octaprenyl-diphosphate synthase